MSFAPDRFLDGYLLYLLAAVSDRASGQFHTHVRDQGLKVPEWRVLACLTDQDGAMITQLARVSLFEQSRMTKTVDQMVGRGLVERRPDPEDSRRVRVYLTDHGRTLATALQADAKQHEATLLAALPQEEAARLKSTLTALLRHLDTG